MPVGSCGESTPIPCDYQYWVPKHCCLSSLALYGITVPLRPSFFHVRPWQEISLVSEKVSACLAYVLCPQVGRVWFLLTVGNREQHLQRLTEGGIIGIREGASGHKQMRYPRKEYGRRRVEKMVETFSWDFFLRASCLLEENSSKLAASHGTYYSPFAVWLPQVWSSLRHHISKARKKVWD